MENKHMKKNDVVEIGAKYKHFKGNLYEVLTLARNSETLEEMVVYKALYGDGQVWCRPLSMWNDVVERDGKSYTRFTKICDE